MDRKKNWKDFQTLVDARPDYRAWLYCKDREEKTLREELLDLVSQLNHYATEVRRIPMPQQFDDAFFSRSSLHINQNIVFCNFIETLFENSLRQESDETMNLLFSFLDTYIALLKEECQWGKE